MAAVSGTGVNPGSGPRRRPATPSTAAALPPPRGFNHGSHPAAALRLCPRQRPAGCLAASTLTAAPAGASRHRPRQRPRFRLASSTPAKAALTARVSPMAAEPLAPRVAKHGVVVCSSGPIPGVRRRARDIDHAPPPGFDPNGGPVGAPEVRLRQRTHQRPRGLDHGRGHAGCLAASSTATTPQPRHRPLTFVHDSPTGALWHRRHPG